MLKFDSEQVKIPFECEDHKTTIEVSPADLSICGTPLCEVCNQEMSIEDYVLVGPNESSD